MTTTPDATPMSLPDMLTQAAIQTSILDALKKSQGNHRNETFARMLDAKAALGVKSFDVRLDGGVVASATITEPSDRHVVSGSGELKQAYLEYMEENYPEQIETIVQVRPAFEKVFLEKLEACGEDNKELVDTATGIIVPGAVNIPASDPTTWSMRFKKGDESKAHVLRTALPEDALRLLGIEPIYGDLPSAPDDEPVVVEDAEPVVVEAVVTEDKPKPRKRTARKKAEPAPAEDAA